MKIMRFLMVSFCFLVFSNCASPGVVNYESDVTLSTMNDSKQPTWADEGSPFKIKNGKVYSVGVTEIKGDERTSAGTRIAENNARAHIAKTVENRMEFIFQNAEEGLSYDSSAAKFIGSEISSLTLSDMKLEGTWWKRYAQSQEDGTRTIKYKIYALVVMNENSLKKAINQAIKKGNSKGKLSKEFQEQVDSQWKTFVNPDEKTKNKD